MSDLQKITWSQIDSENVPEGTSVNIGSPNSPINEIYVSHIITSGGTLTGSSTELYNSINNEKINRISGDTVLLNLINEKTTYTDHDINELVNSVHDEVTDEYRARVESEENLIGLIQERAAVIEVVDLRRRLTGETFNRITGQTSLYNDITNVSNNIQVLFDEEVINRTDGDNDLLNEIIGNTDYLRNKINEESLIRLSGDTENIKTITGKTETLHNELLNEINNRLTGDTYLLSIISNNTSENLITGETQNRIIQDNILRSLITGETLNRISGDTLLHNEISDEINNRTNAIDGLNTQITNQFSGESQTRVLNDNSLFRQITGETQSRISEDNALRNQINNEVSNRGLDFTSLHDQLSNEIQSRTQNEYELLGYIENRASVNDILDLRNKITGETFNRILADNVLYNQITGITAANDALGVYNQLTGETFTRISEDTAIRTQISNEIINRTTGETSLTILINGRASTGVTNTLNNLITGETQTRISEDNILRSLITGETLNRITGDTYLLNLINVVSGITSSGDTSGFQNLITGETQTRISEDNILRSLITGETQIRSTGFTSIVNIVTGESQTRISEDNILRSLITGETLNRTTGDTYLISLVNGKSNSGDTVTLTNLISDETLNRTSGDTSLKVLITGETQTRISEDNILRSLITGETLNRTTGDTYLLNLINVVSGLTSSGDTSGLQRLITGETYNRITGDTYILSILTGITATGDTTTLHNDITGETLNRINADIVLNNLITGETLNRITGNTALTLLINGKASTGTTNTLNNLITGETQARSTGYTSLFNQITGETFNRITGDSSLYTQYSTGYTSLNSAISNEAYYRTTGDTYLLSLITGITTSTGGTSSNGAFGDINEVPSASNVGKIRYRVVSGVSYCEMSMLVSGVTYSWVALGTDGGVKNQTQVSAVFMSESNVGTIQIDGTYDLYQGVYKLTPLPGKQNEETDFILSDQPLGANIFLSINDISISTGVFSFTSTFICDSHQVIKVYVDESFRTIIKIKCVKPTTESLNAIVVVKYVKVDVSTASVSFALPVGTNINTLNLRVPDLKYDKKMALGLTSDDQMIEIWEDTFKYFNGGWIDALKPYHIQMPRTTGTYAPRPLTYTDGCGVQRRFSVNTANFYNLKNGTYWSNPMNRPNPDQYWAMLVWDEAKEMIDFDGSCSFHNVMDSGQTGTPSTAQALSDALDYVNSTLVQDALGRHLMVMTEPDGNMLYTYGAQLNNEIKVIMKEGGTSYGFANINLRDPNIDINKILLNRSFSGNYQADFMTDLVNTRTSSVGMWREIGTHGGSTTLGSDWYLFFDWLCDTYGEFGDDSLWFATAEEVIQYKWLQKYTMVSSTISNNIITIKLLMPKFDNFKWYEISLLLDGIASPDSITVTGNTNVVGVSNGLSNGFDNTSMLINVNCDQTLITRAEKYTHIFETGATANVASNILLEYKRNAEYFIQRLKPSLGSSYTARINALTSPPTLSSIVLNSGNSETSYQTVYVDFTWSGGLPTEMIVSENSNFSGASWVTYSDNSPFVLTSGFTSKTVYAKVKNAFGETSVVNDSITLVVHPLELVSMVINNGDASTSSTYLTATYTYFGEWNIHWQARTGELPDCSDGTWTSFNGTSHSFFIPSVYSTHTIYSQLRTFDMMTSGSTTGLTSSIVSDSILLLDPNVVYLNSISTTTGETASSNVSVVLDFSGNATQYRLDNNTGFTHANWLTYTGSTVPYTLIDGFGVNTIYGQIKNTGNTSTIRSTNITYLTDPFFSSLRLNNGDATCDTPNVNMYFNYSGSPSHYKIGESLSLSGTSWTPFVYPIPYTFANTGVTGTKTVYCQLKNSLSQTSVYWDEITYSLPVEKTILSFGNAGFWSANYYDVYNGKTINVLNLPYRSDSLDNYPLKTSLGTSKGYFVVKTSECLNGSTYKDFIKTAAPSISGTSGAYPPGYLANHYAPESSNTTGNISALRFGSLDPGTYTVRVLESTNVGYTSGERTTNFIQANSGTSVNPAAISANNVTVFTEIPNVTIASNGILDIKFYSTSSGDYYEPGVNLIEIIKTA